MRFFPQSWHVWRSFILPFLCQNQRHQVRGTSSNIYPGGLYNKLLVSAAACAAFERIPGSSPFYTHASSSTITRWPQRNCRQHECTYCTSTDPSTHTVSSFVNLMNLMSSPYSSVHWIKCTLLEMAELRPARFWVHAFILRQSLAFRNKLPIKNSYTYILLTSYFRTQQREFKFKSCRFLFFSIQR